MFKLWVSVDDVTCHLGLTSDSRYRRNEGRSVPAHHVGRVWKFKLSDLDDCVCADGADLSNDPKLRRIQ